MIDLSIHQKIAIVGGPKVGKTTLASTINDGRMVLSTDDFMDIDWPDQPYAILDALRREAVWCVEGIQVARALRKGLQPDCVVLLTVPHVELTTKQAALTKAVGKWFRDWLGTAKLDKIKFYEL